MHQHQHVHVCWERVRERGGGGGGGAPLALLGLSLLLLLLPDLRLDPGLDKAGHAVDRTEGVSAGSVLDSASGAEVTDGSCCSGG